jgi:SAM-dependent methyltransferase
VDRRRAEAKPLTRGSALRGGRDRELEVGSRAHYEDPAYYTHAYARRDEDVSFYVELAASHGGPVLEYGIGNGRIALPLARRGVQVTGVDLSAEMLGDLRAKLAAEPELARRVKMRRGDMRSARLGRRFPLIICAFNTLLHLYDRRDFERFFARVHEHLAPGGSFVLDVSMPSAEELARDPNRAYHTPRFRHPTAKDVVRYTERFDYDPVRQVLFVWIEFTPSSRPREGWVTPLAHRQIFPQELEALLHYNGFVIERISGDFQGSPLDRHSDTMVLHCRHRRGFRAGRA